MSSELLSKYKHNWPYFDPSKDNHWKYSEEAKSFIRTMPENTSELAVDNGWPGFFPSTICFVTTYDGKVTGLEKVLGPSIVNRFPYIIALSFYIEAPSKTNHEKNKFIEILERGRSVAIHYFEPGHQIDTLVNAISDLDNDKIEQRISKTNLSTRKAVSNDAPVFDEAYLVYEAKLVKPGTDFEGKVIYEKPYTDYGSHRIYYLEIEAIQLRKDIALGKSQIYWQSLPYWSPIQNIELNGNDTSKSTLDVRYQKGYTPNFYFPPTNKIAFEFDKLENNMAIKFLPPLPKDQVEVDNERARWPCFFPSSAGMITTWTENGVPNLMPCGSTTILIRHPLCIGICVSYAEINARYASRETINALNKNGRFGCGIPFVNNKIINAIKYAGNVSIKSDIKKIENSGLKVENEEWAPVLSDLPIHFDCEIKKIVRLGTHFLYLGEVKAIRLREDISPDNPLTWYPFPDVITKTD